MTLTPDNWHPAGASDDPRWKIVWAYAVAVSSRTAVKSLVNEAAEQEAVRAVNEMLEKSSDGPCPVPPAKDSAVSTQTACETEGVSSDLSAAARRMPDSVGSLAPVIATSQCENGVSPGPSETIPSSSNAAESVLSTSDRGTKANPAGDVDPDRLFSSPPPKPAPDAMRKLWPLTERQLWEASCLTRAQLEVWTEQDFASHAAGLRHTIKFLMQILDEFSAPVPSPDGVIKKYKCAHCGEISDAPHDGACGVW